MQDYYKNLYNSVQFVPSDNNLCQFIDYKAKSKELEFDMYQTHYGHVIHRYEKMRSTKIWKLAKKVKAKFK